MSVLMEAQLNTGPAGCSKRPEFSPSQPRRLIHPPALSLAKTDSLPWDAPFPKQGLSERPTMILPSLLVYVVLRMAQMSPPLRASNEGLLRPRVARAQGIHRAIPLLARWIFNSLLSCEEMLGVGRRETAELSAVSGAIQDRHFQTLQ